MYPRYNPVTAYICCHWASCLEYPIRLFVTHTFKQYLKTYLFSLSFWACNNTLFYDCVKRPSSSLCYLRRFKIVYFTLHYITIVIIWLVLKSMVSGTNGVNFPAPQIWLANCRHCALYKFIYLLTYLIVWHIPSCARNWFCGEMWNEGYSLVDFWVFVAAECRRSEEAVLSYHAELCTFIVVCQACTLWGDFYQGDFCTDSPEI